MQLTSSPTPDDGIDDVAFFLCDIAGTFPGAFEGVVDLYFWHEDSGGGIEIDDFYGDTVLMLADGPQLYTGTEILPTFTLGKFAMTEYGGGSGTYSLTISAGPEPTSYALLLGGLGLIVSVAARRRKD